MSLRMWVAPVGLFLLQAAPVGVEVDSVGRLQVMFGVGAGSYQERLTSCSGEVLDEYDVSTKTIGAAADYWITPSVRVSGQLGNMAASSERAAPDRINPLYQGAYGGALVAYEGKKFGIGGGVASMPLLTGDEGSDLIPAYYVRFGTRSGPHARIEEGTAGLVPAPPNVVRMGLGFGDGLVHQVGGLFGLAVNPWPAGEASVGAFGSLRVPVSHRLDLAGTAGVGLDGYAKWDLAIGLRLNLGQPPRPAATGRD